MDLQDSSVTMITADSNVRSEKITAVSKSRKQSSNGNNHRRKKHCSGIGETYHFLVVVTLV